MTAGLLRQDPMIRSMGKPFIVLLPFVQLYLGIVVYLHVRNAPPADGLFSSGYVTSAILCCLAVVIFQQLPGARQRVSDFALGLPLSPRWLWWVHLLALALVGCAVVALTSGSVVLINTLFSSRFEGGLIPLAPNGKDLFLHSLGAMLIMVVIVQTQSPQLVTIPWGRRALWRGIAAFGVGLILLLSYSLVSSLAVVLSVGAAVVIALRFERRLPRAWSVLPKQPDTLDAAGSRIEWQNRGASRAPRSLRQIYCVYLTLAPKPWALPLVLPMLIFWGVQVSGASTSDLFDDDTRFLYSAITSYILLAFGPGLLNRAWLIDHLPLSRARLLVMLNLPVVVIFLAGYAGGAFYVAKQHDAHERIRLEDIDGHHYVRVPIGACEISWDGVVDDNRAPWGESHEPWTTGVWRDEPLLLYSPYSTPEGSSLDFVAYQLQQAVMEIYGANLGWEQIRDRYLELEVDGDVVPRGGQLTLAVDHPEWRTRTRGTVAPVQLGIILVFWLALLWCYIAVLRATVTGLIRKVVQFSLLGFAMLVHMSVFVLGIWGSDVWITSGLFRILIRDAADILPGGAATLWLLSIAAVAAAHGLVLRRLDRAEFPICRTGC